MREALLVGLEVNVGDAGIDGIDEDLLDVADDRRVLDLVVLLVRHAGDGALQEIDLQVVHLADVRQGDAGRFDETVDRLRELVVLDDDRLDHEIRLEANFLECLEVRGIGSRDVEAVAPLVQRQDAPRLGNLEVDQVLADLVEVECPEIHQRNAEGARGERCELGGREPLALDQLLDERDIALLRLRLQPFGLVLGYQPMLRKGARESAQVARGGGLCGHGEVVRSGALWPENIGIPANQAIYVPLTPADAVSADIPIA